MHSRSRLLALPLLLGLGLCAGSHGLSSPVADDSFGFRVCSTPDADGDGCPDILIADPFCDRSGPNTGGVWLISGKTGEKIRSFVGASVGDRLGLSLIALDCPGEEGPLLLIGRLGLDDQGERQEFLEIYTPSQTESVSRIDGGQGVAIVGDVSGDGLEDLAVWSSLPADSGMGFAHRVAILSLPTEERVQEIELTTESPIEWIGVGAGQDIDGDDLGDIVVASHQGEDTLEIEIFSGQSGESLWHVKHDLEVARYGYSSLSKMTPVATVLPNAEGAPASVLVGVRAYDRSSSKWILRASVWSLKTRGQTLAFTAPYGEWIEVTSDMDGDQRADYLVRCPTMPLSGAVVYYSSQDGRRIKAVRPSDSVGFGYSLDSRRDFTGDGINDMVVGAHLDGLLIEGSVSLVDGERGTSLRQWMKKDVLE